MKTPPQKKPKAKTQIEMADLLNVSRKTLGNWKRQGINTSEANLEELKELAAVVDLRQATSGEIATARLRKINLEADRLQYELSVRRGEFMHIEDIHTTVAEFAMVSRRLWNDLEQHLPPALEGLTALGMATVIRAHTRKCLSEISDHAANLSFVGFEERQKNGEPCISNPARD